MLNLLTSANNMINILKSCLASGEQQWAFPSSWDPLWGSLLPAECWSTTTFLPRKQGVYPTKAFPGKLSHIPDLIMPLCPAHISHPTWILASTLHFFLLDFYKPCLIGYVPPFGENDAEWLWILVRHTEQRWWRKASAHPMGRFHHNTGTRFHTPGKIWGLYGH